MVLVFLLSAFLLVGVSLMADYCAAPAYNTLNVTGLNKDSIASYFFTVCFELFFSRFDNGSFAVRHYRWSQPVPDVGPHFRQP